MPFSVYLTDDAARDLEDLDDYIERHDVQGKEDYVLDQIKNAFTSLTENPHCCIYPRELSAIGIQEYREIFFKPYRFVYRVLDRNVYVVLIADGLQA